MNDDLQSLWEGYLKLQPGALGNGKAPKHQPPAPGSGLEGWDPKLVVNNIQSYPKPTVSSSAPSLAGLDFSAVEAQAAAYAAQFQLAVQAAAAGRYSKAKPKPAPPPAPPSTMIVGNAKRRIAL